MRDCSDMSRLRGTGNERSIYWALFSPRGRIRGKTYALGFFAVALFYFGMVLVLQEIFAVDGTMTDGPAVLVALGLPVSVWCLLMLVWKRKSSIRVIPAWNQLNEQKKILPDQHSILSIPTTRSRKIMAGCPLTLWQNRVINPWATWLVVRP